MDQISMYRFAAVEERLKNFANFEVVGLVKTFGV